MTAPKDLFFQNVAPLGGHGTVRITWLGTAGFIIENDGHVLLIDPYVTRSSLTQTLLQALKPNLPLTTEVIPRADAIILSHTHFDHALDVPAIARRTGARVYGSLSAIQLCRSEGVAETQLECVEPQGLSKPHEAESGPFHLRFWPSAHSAFLLGRVPFPGDIADCSEIPMRSNAYRCGAVFGTEIEVASRRLFHVGSAELIESRWQVRPVDLALACVAGWTTTDRYPERLVSALSPGVVLLHHWDNFFRAFQQEARALPGMRFDSLADRMRKAAPDVAIGALPLRGSIVL